MAASALLHGSWLSSSSSAAATSHCWTSSSLCRCLTKSHSKVTKRQFAIKLESPHDASSSLAITTKSDIEINICSESLRTEFHKAWLHTLYLESAAQETISQLFQGKKTNKKETCLLWTTFSFWLNLYVWGYREMHILRFELIFICQHYWTMFQPRLFKCNHLNEKKTLF